MQILNTEREPEEKQDGTENQQDPVPGPSGISRSQLQDILASGDHCADQNCKRPTGEDATYISCMHCTKKYHIRCIQFTIQRARTENFICNACLSTHH